MLPNSPGPSWAPFYSSTALTGPLRRSLGTWHSLTLRRGSGVCQTRSVVYREECNSRIRPRPFLLLAESPRIPDVLEHRIPVFIVRQHCLHESNLHV
jgi:hypothetical protein